MQVFGSLGRKKFLFILSALGISSAAELGLSLEQEDGKLSTNDLKAAEKLAGIELNDREREEILEDVNKNKAVYGALRKQPVDYFQFPSLTFNPVPPGMRFAMEKKKPVFSKPTMNMPFSSPSIDMGEGPMCKRSLSGL